LISVAKNASAIIAHRIRDAAELAIKQYPASLLCPSQLAGQ
jgi:hypothetical protein